MFNPEAPHVCGFPNEIATRLDILPQLDHGLLQEIGVAFSPHAHRGSPSRARQAARAAEHSGN